VTFIPLQIANDQIIEVLCFESYIPDNISSQSILLNSCFYDS